MAGFRGRLKQEILCFSDNFPFYFQRSLLSSFAVNNIPHFEALPRTSDYDLKISMFKSVDLFHIRS